MMHLRHSRRNCAARVQSGGVHTSGGVRPALPSAPAPPSAVEEACCSRLASCAAGAWPRARCRSLSSAKESDRCCSASPAALPFCWPAASAAGGVRDASKKLLSAPADGRFFLLSCLPRSSSSGVQRLVARLSGGGGVLPPAQVRWPHGVPIVHWAVAAGAAFSLDGRVVCTRACV